MSMPELFRKMDELLQVSYPSVGPGAAVIVMKEGQVLLRKGYGKANLELDVPVEPHMVFRIGSITKQFTAVCILMLLEEGKLSLQDEITRLLPDYPTQGRKITVEHLLTHTSGIVSYTSLPEWLPLWRKDMTLDEIIDLFKDRPMEFEPGEKFSYNNSGYILLGAIIEKLSGKSYAAFVQERIFDRLGMTRTLYDDTARIVPGRASGYTLANNGFANAAYLSMSQPYAAGSLASCVDDLARWDTALYAGELVSPETLALAHRSYRLLDGSLTNYGYGWTVSEYEGFQFLEHAGGINGFLCGGVRVPEARVYVALLSNLESPRPNPDMLAFQLASMVIGKPYSPPVAIELNPEALQEYVGVYAINEKEERIVTCEDGRLCSQRTGGMRLKLIPYGKDAFFINEEADRFIFIRGEDGKVNEMEVRRRLGPEERAIKIDKPLPQVRQSVLLEPGLLPNYTGVFELAPGMAITIGLMDGSLYAQAGGQEKLMLHAESPLRLFAREVEMTFGYEFDELGKATRITLYQNSQTFVCKRVG